MKINYRETSLFKQSLQSDKLKCQHQLTVENFLII